jgi:hypothetical protein
VEVSQPGGASSGIRFWHDMKAGWLAGWLLLLLLLL